MHTGAMILASFFCPHCGTEYTVETVPAPYDPDDNSAACDGCGGVMAVWYASIRPRYRRKPK